MVKIAQSNGPVNVNIVRSADINPYPFKYTRPGKVICIVDYAPVPKCTNSWLLLATSRSGLILIIYMGGNACS